MGPRDVRLERVANLLIPGERVQQHGVARHEEVERTGRGLGRGLLAATSMRLIFSPDRGSQPIEMPYTTIERIRRRRRILTHDLIVVMRGGDALTFNAARRFLVKVEEVVATEMSNAAHASPPGLSVVCAHGRTMCTFCWPPSGLPTEAFSEGE